MPLQVKILLILVFAISKSLGALISEKGKDSKSKIINGTPVGGTYAINWGPKDEYISGTSKEFPYVVSLEEYGVNFCGGAIITKDIVLTAAHCIFSNPPRNLDYVTVRGGRLAAEGPLSPTSQKRKAMKVIKHEKYDIKSGEKGYDLAVIKLNEAFNLDDYVNVVQLPESSKLLQYSDRIGFSLGWGNTEDGMPSKVLLKMTAEILTERHCNTFPMLYDRRLICALGRNGSNVCSSDSGGPLVIHYKTNPKEDVLVGIHSFTRVVTKDYVFKVCYGGDPYYSTNVAYFRDWINVKLNEI